jgi:hypothetical protein
MKAFDTDGVVAKVWWSQANEFAQIEPPIIRPGSYSGTRTLEQCIGFMAQSEGKDIFEGFEESRAFEVEIHGLPKDEARLKIDERFQRLGHSLVWETQAIS